VRLVNLTIADHPQTGLLLPTGLGRNNTLHNSVLYGNLVDLSGDLDAFSNLPVGNPDPLFASDYHLLPGSLARDAASAAHRSGLGTQDADGNPRTHGAAIDFGALECGRFCSNLETDGLAEWSSHLP
jgi:hypothetical protein